MPQLTRLLMRTLAIKVLLLMTFLSVWGEKVVLTDHFEGKLIGKQISFLKDENRNLTLNEILSPNIQKQFVQSKENIPSYGKGDFALWIKIEVSNEATEILPWYLEIAYPTFDSLHFFSAGKSGWQSRLVGDVMPFSVRSFEHRNFIFDLPIKPGEEHTFYIRISTRGSIIVPIEINQLKNFHSKHVKEDLLFGIFYGIMGVMMLYNLFLAASIQSYSYLFYVLIILGNLLTLSALNGHALQHIWGDWPWMGNVIVVFGIGLWIGASNLFARRFLEARIYSVAYNKIFIIMAILGGLLMLSSLLLEYKWSLWFGNILLAINCINLLVSGIFFWVRRVLIAKLFTIAWSLYLLGVIMYNFRNLGLFPVNFFTSHILEVGAIIEVIILSIALGFKYRSLELERREAKNLAIKALAENKRIVEENNELLEKSIEERTKELRERQEEILAKNKELEKKNSKLTEAYDIIGEQNEILKEYSENLEIVVSQRTVELSTSNRELAENVQKLEQYAYITAHNLRGPVARLMGLIHLLKIKPEQIKDPETLNIIDKIKYSGKELDTIIRDMNTILEMKHAANEELAEVAFEDKLRNCMDILREPILNAQAKIEHDFSEVPSIKTNPVFLDSILYNLLSNAIKYRSSERMTLISLKSYRSEQFTILKVSDNGLGIDLRSYGGQLFGMYKRFHSHIEGKGLGLYLVKSQMEMAGGHIEVESELGTGTTFYLYLKDAQ